MAGFEIDRIWFNVSRGTSKPLSVLFTSSIELGSGEDPSVLMEICAETLIVAVRSNAKEMIWFFIRPGHWFKN